MQRFTKYPFPKSLCNSGVCLSDVSLLFLDEVEETIDIQDPRLTNDLYTLDEVEETIVIQDPRLTDDTYTLDEVEETMIFRILD